MRISKKLRQIADAMVQDTGCALNSYTYSTKPSANVTLDRGKPSPVAVVFVVTDIDLDVNGLMRERAEVNVSMLVSQKPIDKNHEDVDDTIMETSKELCVDFVSRILQDKTLMIDDDTVHLKAVFDRSDSNRSGYNLTMTLVERQGECWT